MPPPSANPAAMAPVTYSLAPVTASGTVRPLARPAAMALAAASIFGILKRTAAAGAPEMLLIEAQDELVIPSETFPVEPV